MRPSLDLSFARTGHFHGAARFGIDQCDGTSGGRVRRSRPGPVLHNSAGKVSGGPDVERIVRPLEDVTEGQGRRRCHRLRAKARMFVSLPFDSVADAPLAQGIRLAAVTGPAMSEPRASARGESNGGGGSRTRTWRDHQLVDGARLLGLTRSFDSSCRQSALHCRPRRSAEIDTILGGILEAAGPCARRSALWRRESDSDMPDPSRTSLFPQLPKLSFMISLSLARSRWL